DDSLSRVVSPRQPWPCRLVNRHHIRDLHATILHLMGLDHETLTYHYGGLDQRLTGVIPATPIGPVIA
ncbi:MAG: DUF1501 domain-containing protein, partial [Verrucomicrobiota bacterium]|nr:DUF1501 domain-containing protein [Verrucomicrobiota bacterium]